MSAIDRIKEIEEKAKAQIDELRKEAAAELLRRISALKEELANLEGQFAQLTGKPLPTASPTNSPETTKTPRKRLSSEEKAALVETVRATLAAKPTGVSMGELVRTSGESSNAVREALLGIKYKTTGNKASTKYYLK